MLKLKILILIILFSVILVNAQKNIEFSKKNFQNNEIGLQNALKDIENANVYFNISPGAYRIALKFYLRANSFNPNNAELNYKIGRCYLHSDNKEKAIQFLEKSIGLDANSKLPVKCFLGQAYHFQHRFREAIIAYNMFLKNISRSNDKKYRKLAEKGIIESQFAAKLIQQPVVKGVENLGSSVNSMYADYSPVFGNNETLLFTSRRKSGNTDKTSCDSIDFQFYEDVYTSKKEENKWGKAKNVGKSENKVSHNGIVSTAGSIQILYRAENNGDLYIKHKNEEAKPFPETINTEFSETSAVLSKDGKTLYFISNKKDDSFGGKDIYYSERKNNGKWGKAVNIGEPVNSQFDEDGLFLHYPTNTLFFSSKRLGGMGGYDIYRTVKEDTSWSKPVNIGYPINTTGNDIHFTISPDCKTAYFASDRKGGEGMHDIYSCEINDKILHVNFLEGKITSLKGNIPLQALVKVFDKDENEIFVKTTNRKDGKFLGTIPAGKNHTLVVNSKNFLFYSEKFDISDKSLCYNLITKEIKLTKAVKGNKIILGAVEFDFNSANLRKESSPALNSVADYILKNPSMKVEIGGHTDNKGTHQYNLELSTNRAKAVVEYLISKRVRRNQITYKGYSFDKPIDTNDTEDGRQKNRRVEFTIKDK